MTGAGICRRPCFCSSPDSRAPVTRADDGASTASLSIHLGRRAQSRSFIRVRLEPEGVHVRSASPAHEVGGARARCVFRGWYHWLQGKVGVPGTGASAGLGQSQTRALLDRRRGRRLLAALGG